MTKIASHSADLPGQTPQTLEESVWIGLKADDARNTLADLDLRSQADAAAFENRRVGARQITSSLTRARTSFFNFRDWFAYGSSRRLRFLLRRRNLFIDDWYRDRYKVIGWDALGHFVSVGISSDLSPNPFFDAGWYAELHTLRAGSGEALFHYLEHGSSQALAPGPLFDPVEYLMQYPELGMEPDLLGHYLRDGIREGRMMVPLRYL